MGAKLQACKRGLYTVGHMNSLFSAKAQKWGELNQRGPTHPWLNSTLSLQ